MAFEKQNDGRNRIGVYLLIRPKKGYKLLRVLYIFNKKRKKIINKFKGHEFFFSYNGQIHKSHFEK